MKNICIICREEHPADYRERIATINEPYHMLGPVFEQALALQKALQDILDAWNAPHYGDHEARLDHIYEKIPAAIAVLAMSKRTKV